MDYPTYEEILKMKEDGVKDVWVKLSQKYGKSKDSLRSWFNREREKRKAYETLLDTEELPEDSQVQEKRNIAEDDISYNDNGSLKYVSSVRLIKMHEENSKDSRFVLSAHGFNPDEWILINCKNNYWQGMRAKDAGSATLYQSKITVKPKNENESISIVQIENFFRDFKFEISKPLSPRKIGGYSNKKLLINLADAHIGNYSDGFSAEQSIRKLIDEVLVKSERMEFNEVILANLGDLLHIDNYAGQTTSGTQVGQRGNYPALWEEALKILIESIEKLKKISKVRFISISGNHDKISSFTIAKSLEYFYKNDLMVETDCDFSERKYIQIGNSLFGFAHGDLPAKNIPSILQREAREMFGKTKYAYVLLGHIHHTNIIDKDGVIVTHLPSITPSDEWHKGQGYVGTWKGTLCYVIDEQDGISETWHIGA